jgi:hypothetical protein
MSIRVFANSILLLLCWALSGANLLAKETGLQHPAQAELSRGGNDFRTTEVRKYFEHLGRDFGVYRIVMLAPDDAAYIADSHTYHLDRKRAGNFRYSSLKVSKAAFYKAIAKSVNEHFEPLTDTVNNDGSDVTSTEWLQMIFRQARALKKAGADLDAVDARVTVTYVYDGQYLVVAPTTFNFVDNAVNAKGSSLHKHFGVNSFSKHYLLALILNESAEVTMAGKIYIQLKAREAGTIIDLEHVFAKHEVDLEKFEFELTVTNESGTFKPAAEGLPPFARVLAEALNLPELNYSSRPLAGSEPLTGTVHVAIDQ